MRQSMKFVHFQCQLELARLPLQPARTCSTLSALINPNSMERTPILAIWLFYVRKHSDEGRKKNALRGERQEAGMQQKMERASGVRWGEGGRGRMADGQYLFPRRNDAPHLFQKIPQQTTHVRPGFGLLFCLNLGLNFNI